MSSRRCIEMEKQSSLWQFADEMEMLSVRESD